MNQFNFIINTNEKLIDGRYNIKFLFCSRKKHVDQKTKKRNSLDETNIYKKENKKRAAVIIRSNSCIINNNSKRNSLPKLVEFINVNDFKPHSNHFGPHQFTSNIQINTNNIKFTHYFFFKVFFFFF